MGDTARDMHLGTDSWPDAAQIAHVAQVAGSSANEASVDVHFHACTTVTGYSAIRSSAVV